MDIYILPIVTLLCIIVLSSDASITPETYWKNVLPNTPMPLAIRNSLSRLENEGKGNLDVVNRAETSISYRTGISFTYNNKAQVLDEPTRGLFFLEKDMKVGSLKSLQLMKSLNGATFITREEANAIPFSSDKVSEILRQFSLKSDSREARIMKNTIKECESKSIQGEQKYCATSLESMVDYATSTLGKNIKAISTVIRNNDNNVEKYTITAVKKTTTEDNENIVCHKDNYAYAVFYCHKSKATSSYLVSLVGPKGSWAKAVAVCHMDTSGWNPKHLAFQVLNVTPGTVPICHFLPEDHILWVANN